MPNKNYLSGRRLEYEVMKLYKKAGCDATRTAGSHGWVDVVAKIPPTSEFTFGELLPGFQSGTTVDSNYMVFVRDGKKYKDALHIWAYSNDGNITTLHLVQCKRKKVKA